MKADFDEMKNVELICLSLSLSLASFSPILAFFFSSLLLPYLASLFPTFTV
jgi:hypothetical protein